MMISNDFRKNNFEIDGKIIEQVIKFKYLKVTNSDRNIAPETTR